MRAGTIGAAVWGGLLSAVTGVGAANWDRPLGSSGHYLLEFQLDPYYTALDLIGPLAGDTISRVPLEEGEWAIYQTMLKKIHRPRFWLAEVSLNPLPIVGVWMKSEARSVYDRSEIAEGFNAVRILTDGFPEPGAVSFFLGNVDEVVDSVGEVRGRGYGGLLLSVGGWHIVDNELIEDLWLETEVKLKGGKVTPTEEWSWSFAVGGKFHRHPEISNALYLSLIRTQTDRKGGFGTGWGIFRNSAFEYRVELDVARIPKFYRYLDRTAIRYVALVGKRWPIRGGAQMIGFDLGVLRQVGTGYTGELGASIDRGWFALFRPSFGF